MILTADVENNIEVETSGINSIVGGIDESNISIIMEMVSSSFYSNKIGSIIRELTSNCFDSHKRANVDNPVVVKVDFDEENETYYIEFKDVGTGLSPDAIRNIYTRWFTSDKRNNNNEIGGFGIGSKSAFAYSDIFYINTVCEGIRYDYIHYKDQRNAKGVREFKLDLLLEEKTNQRNGTSVRIDIEQKDLPKFLYEIIAQLSFFDNVFIQKGVKVHSIFENENPHKLSNFNNEKIYEYKTFKYRDRTLSHYTDSELFILIDTVKYPIDFKEIGVPMLSIPFGLKFKIGELSVTPNRENIEYTEKNKNLIIERYHELIKEVGELITKQNTFEFDTLTQYNRYIGSLYLKLGNENNFCNLMLDKDVVKKNFGIDAKKIYKPLKDFPYEINNKVLDLFYVVAGRIDENGNLNDTLCTISYLQLQGETVFYVDKVSKLNKAINFSLPTGTYIITRKKYTKDDINRFMSESFGYYYSKDRYRYNAKRLNHIDFNDTVLSNDNFLHCDNYDYNKKKISVTRKQYDEVLRKKVNKTITANRHVRTAIVPNKAVNTFTLFKHFNSILKKVNYSEIVLTDEMIEDYKEFLKDKNKTLKRKKNGKVLIYLNGLRIEYLISDLKKKKFIFYKIRNEKNYFTNNKNELIEVTETDIRSILYETDSSVLKNIKSYFKDAMIIEISKSNFNQIKNLKNIVAFNDFFTLPVVKSLLVRKAFYQLINRVRVLYNQESTFTKLCKLSSYYNNIYNTINKQTKYIFDNLNPKFYNFTEEEIRKNSSYSNILDLVNKYHQINKDLNILKYVYYNSPPQVLKEILTYDCIKNNKVKYLKFLNSYYVYPTHILVDIITKGNHYKNLKEEKEIKYNNNNKNLVYL